MSELLVDKELTRILEYLKAHIHKLGVSLVSGNSQNVVSIDFLFINIKYLFTYYKS